MSARVVMLGLLVLPGVVFHELGHYLFCRLVGVRVHEVVYFRFGNPAGYVVHTTPRHFRDHFAIVVGPFVVNSLAGFLLFISVVGKWTRPYATAGIEWQWIVVWTIALWLGVSLSLQAFPSKGDARSLWQAASRHVRRGNILALVGYPVVGLIYLANVLRRLWLDWLYAAALITVSALVF
ncbi:MAG: DUF3267 domain-containing protein [Chloroflexi bacterium]|nr:DUF3267 domain-containing protein [Chloroflexota bacterium]